MYLTCMIVVCGFSLIITTLVMNLYHKDPVTPLNKNVRIFIFNILGRMLLFDYHKCPIHPAGDNEKLKIKHKNEMMVIKDIEGEKDMKADNPSDHVLELRKIYAEICKLTGKVKENTEDEALKEEWKKVANVLDRLFLVLFVILTTGLSVGVIL